MLKVLHFCVWATLLLCAVPAHAQETEVGDTEPADTLIYPHWTAKLSAKLNASQASYHNWTEGGVNSLAAVSAIAGEFVRQSPSWTHTYETRLAVGVVKQDTLNLRKSEDVIRLRGTINYVGDGLLQKFTPTFSAGVRTQFAPGYNYEKNPFDPDGPVPVKVSNFFSPATFTQSLGFEYGSEWGFKQRLGVGAKETVVFEKGLRELYGVNPSNPVRFQVGLESHTEIDKEIFENVRFKSALGLFAAFNQEELPDMMWENLIVMKVNSWLSADFEFVSMFDRDISDEIQIREAFAVGISVVII